MHPLLIARLSTLYSNVRTHVVRWVPPVEASPQFADTSQEIRHCFAVRCDTRQAPRVLPTYVPARCWQQKRPETSTEQDSTPQIVPALVVDAVLIQRFTKSLRQYARVSDVSAP